MIEILMLDLDRPIASSSFEVGRKWSFPVLGLLGSNSKKAGVFLSQTCNGPSFEETWHSDTYTENVPAMTLHMHELTLLKRNSLRKQVVFLLM